LPGVLFDIVDLDDIDDTLLVDAASKGEEVLVFEAAEGGA